MSLTYEELKKEFIEQGFRIEGDNFIHEFEDPNTIINGVHPKKRFEMVYIYEGCVVDSDDSDEDESLYEFNVLGPNKETVFTICIGSFNDFVKLVG